MKKSKKCPKCNGSEIYTDRGLAKRGDRVTIPISSWSKLFLDTYICIECGYFEEYIENDYLKDEKKIEKLKSEWRKY